MPPKVETKLVNERSTDIVVRRQNLETRTIGKSVIASAVSTDHIEVRGTGADAGTGDVSLWLKKTGVKPGLYNQVKVDEYGRVIQASYVDNAGSGATDATIWNQSIEAQAANFWISGNGRVNGSLITGSVSTGALSVTGAVNFAALTLDAPLAVTSGGTGTASVAAKSFFAGPVNGTDAAPAWRFIVASDLPPIPFTFLTGLPNTLQLHGITDAYTKTQVDSLVSGLVTRTTAQTITAEKTFTAGIKIANVGDPETSYLLSSVAGELYWNGVAVGSGGSGGYALPIATDSVLGGIKVGSGLSINGSTGVLSVSSTQLFDHVDFNASATTPSYLTGRLYWDTAEYTLSLCLASGSILQIGQELLLRAVNNTGSTITNGRIVYVSGAQGNRPTVALADATDDVKSKVVAVATQDVADNEVGFFTLSGLVHDIDTSAVPEGGEAWLSTTPGMMASARPAAPNAAVCIGTVVRSHATVGHLFVRVNRGLKLGEIGNVSLTSVQNGDVLKYSGGVWVNAPESSTAPVNMVTTDTAQTITGAKTFSVAGALTAYDLVVSTGDIYVDYTDAGSSIHAYGFNFRFNNVYRALFRWNEQYDRFELNVRENNGSSRADRMIVPRDTAQPIQFEVGGIQVSNGGVLLASSVPSSTTNKLYNSGGTLYWNGSAVGTSSFTASRVPFGASSGGNLTESGNLTFTLTGGYPELVVGSPTSAFSSYIIADAAVGVGAGYGFREGGVNRWIWNFDSNDANKPFKVRSYSSLGAYIDSPLEIENASGGTILVGGSTARLLSVTGAVTITGVLTVNNRSVFTTTMSAHGSVNTILVTANHDQSSGAAWALTAATRFKSGAGADSDAKGHTSFTTFQDSVSVASSGLNKARGFYAVAGQNDATNSSCGVYYGYSTLTGSGSGVTTFTTYASFVVDDENYTNAAFTNRFGLLVKTGNVTPSAGWFGVYIEDGPASPSRYSIYTGNAPSRFGGSVELPSFTPSSTANRLYNASGTLYWNGNQVGDAKKFTVSDIAPSANTSMTSAWINQHTRVAPTAAVNIVVEPGIASVGDELQLLQSNTTFFTLTAGSGVTLRCATSQTTIQPRAQWSGIRLICVATNTFDVLGDFTP